MALKVLFPNSMTEEYEIKLKNYLLSRAIKRQQRLRTEDPVVELFWENYEHITSIHNTPKMNEKLNHSKDVSIIAINLSEYRTLCKHFRLETPDSRTLKRRLKNSVQRKLIEPNIPT